MRELAEIIFTNLSLSSLDPSTLARFYTLLGCPSTSNIPQLILELDFSYSLAGALLDREMSHLYRRLHIPFTSSITLRPSPSGILERRETPHLGIDGLVILLVGEIRADPERAVDMVNLFLSTREDIAVPEIPREAAPAERDEGVSRVVEGVREDMRQRLAVIQQELEVRRVKEEEERKRHAEKEERRRRAMEEESRRMEMEMRARREEMDRWMEMGRRRMGRGFSGDEKGERNEGSRGLGMGMGWRLWDQRGRRGEEETSPPLQRGMKRDGSHREEPSWMGTRMGGLGMMSSGFMDMGMNMGPSGIGMRMRMGSTGSPLKTINPGMMMDISWMDPGDEIFQ